MRALLGPGGPLGVALGVASSLGCGAPSARDRASRLTIAVPTPPADDLVAHAARAPADRRSCSIVGTRLSLTTPSIDLCGEPGGACFGRLEDATLRWTEVERLTISPSLDAWVEVLGRGVSVRAFLPAHAIALHPVSARLVGGYFIPTQSTLAALAVEGETIQLAVAPDRELTPAAPLVATWPCSGVSVDEARITQGEVLVALGLDRQIDGLVATVPRVEVRSAPEGPVVAQIERRQLGAWVFERRHEQLKVVLPITTGFVLGWVDTSGFAKPTGGGSHRTRPPSVRMGESRMGVACPRPVKIMLDLQGRSLHVATVKRGTFFEPTDLRGTLGRVFELAPGAVPWVQEHELRECAE